LHRAIAGYTRRNYKGKTKQNEACVGIVTCLLKNGASTEGYNQQGHTPLHTAVRKGSLDIVQLLTSNRDKESLTRIIESLAKSNDARKETALQMAVRLGEQDIVKLLKALDTSWKNNDVEILKTVYPVVTGGHEEILGMLIEDATLDWKKYSDKCLFKAVEDNNVAAVNFLYGKKCMHPSEDAGLKASVKAAENKNKFIEMGSEKEIVSAERIVAKLASVADKTMKSSPRRDIGQAAGELKISEKKKEYMKLLKNIRGKSKADAFLEMKDDLTKFVKIYSELEQLSKDGGGVLSGWVGGVVETGKGLLELAGLEQEDKVTLEFVQWLMERYEQHIEDWRSKGKTKDEMMKELERKANKYLSGGGGRWESVDMEVSFKRIVDQKLFTIYQWK